MRPLLLASFVIGILALVVFVLSKLGYAVTYVVSPSVPRGFYLITPTKPIKRYAIVQFRPPVAVVTFLRKQHWGAASGLMLKYVYAMPGDFVCNSNQKLQINGKKVAPLYFYYAPGKLLPKQNFCRRLTGDEYLLISNKVARSFDGRYFGPIKRSAIVGVAENKLPSKLVSFGLLLSYTFIRNAHLCLVSFSLLTSCVSCVKSKYLG